MTGYTHEPDKNNIYILEFKVQGLHKYLHRAGVSKVSQIEGRDALDFLSMPHIWLRSVLDINNALVKAGFIPLKNMDTIHQYVKQDEERAKTAKQDKIITEQKKLLEHLNNKRERLENELRIMRNKDLNWKKT